MRQGRGKVWTSCRMVKAPAKAKDDSDQEQTASPHATLQSLSVLGSWEHEHCKSGTQGMSSSCVGAADGQPVVALPGW